MKLDTRTLHMLRFQFDITRLLARARLDRLPLHHVDLGYLVHCHLVRIFGELAPRLFHVQGIERRLIEVLSYGDSDPDELRECGRRNATQGEESHCWETLAGKAMPKQWIEGGLYSFRLRACPVVRMGTQSHKHRKGAEVDSFLARCWALGPEARVDREAVYREWLEEQLESRNAGKVLRTQLKAFQRTRLIRRTQGSQRKAHTCERPDAVLEGTLQVGDPEAFDNLLRRGIGRHRAFGFGMLLLRSQGVN